MGPMGELIKVMAAIAGSGVASRASRGALRLI
jgi:hypothetical protein